MRTRIRLGGNEDHVLTASFSSHLEHFFQIFALTSINKTSHISWSSDFNSAFGTRAVKTLGKLSKTSIVKLLIHLKSVDCPHFDIGGIDVHTAGSPVHFSLVKVGNLVSFVDEARGRQNFSSSLIIKLYGKSKHTPIGLVTTSTPARSHLLLNKSNEPAEFKIC